MVYCQEKPALEAGSGLAPENFEDLWNAVMERLRDPANRVALAGPFVDEERFNAWIANSLVTWAGSAFWPTDRPENTLFWADASQRDEILAFWVRLVEYLGRVMRVVIGLESGAISGCFKDFPHAAAARPRAPVGICAAGSAFFKHKTPPPSEYLSGAIEFVDSTTTQHMHVGNIRTLDNLRAVLGEEYRWDNVLALWVEVGDDVFPILLDDDGSCWMDVLEMCGDTVVVWVEN